MAVPDPVEVAWTACNPGVPLPAALERGGRGRGDGEPDAAEQPTSARLGRKGVPAGRYHE
jgi:hypothetical protein